MQIIVDSRVLVLVGVLAALFGGCVKRDPSPESVTEQRAAYGGGWLALMYPQLRERPLAGTSASGDTVVRLFQTQAFSGSHIERVERRRAGWMYVYKYHRERTDAPPLNVDSVLVESALVDSLLATIRASNYWRDASATCNTIQLDGQSVTIEARIGAKYYTVKCSRSVSLPSDVKETLAIFRLISSRASDRPRVP